ncbi:hypothetical protein [Oceanispirochaeta crateris]|uniref:hypothetical protein n=1 Tax=Oceanispirochaeta crateris TaxID=2518645 RepID=UPI00143DD478|nr:hypothetical protein [Oceanispirochaeta crateris]
MFIRNLRTIPFLILLIFISCSQESPVIMNEGEGYSFESVNDGTILEPGSSVNVVLTEIGDRSTLVRVILEDELGEDIATVEIEPDLLKGLGLPMDLPSDLEDGVYHLRFEILDGDILLHEENRYLFIASGDYEIKSLETYPPGIKPGDNISARVVLSYPEGSDPWLRWSIDETLIQEGFLSELGLICDLTVPDVAGVYSLQVELFPIVPEDNQFSSSFRQSDLFVLSGEGDESAWAFTENRTYQYFIDFNDGMANKMNPSDVPQLVGSPTPFTIGNYSGISFGEEDGLIFDQYALPLDSTGKAEGFLMSMAFSYSYLPDKGVYNIFKTGDENTYFSVLYLAESREFLCEFSSYSRHFVSMLPVDQIYSSEAIYLEIDYMPGQGVASLSWKNQGETLVRDEGLPVSSLMEGQTVIGSNNEYLGFPMNWYTLGVSSKNEATDLLPQDGISNEKLNDMTLLYEKSQKRLTGLQVENAELGDGLATLEIHSIQGNDDNWVFILKSMDGQSLYSFSVPSESEGSPESVVISIINDNRGLFLSTSMDTGMNGPFEYQDLLNFEIIPENGSPEAMDGIDVIRLFRD